MNRKYFSKFHKSPKISYLFEKKCRIIFVLTVPVLKLKHVGWIKAYKIFKSHLLFRTKSDRTSQRIYIYKEYKATSPRLHTGAFYSRKKEAVRKTTPELLSAVLRGLLCGGILCTLYSRVGQFFRF